MQALEGKRGFRFSKGIKERFDAKEREQIAEQFRHEFSTHGRYYMQINIAGELIVCEVTPKLLNTMLEVEW